MKTRPYIPPSVVQEVKEYSNMLLDKATSSNCMVKEKYVTVSCYKKTIEEARTCFARVTTELNSHFARLGYKCAEVNGEDELRMNRTKSLRL